jgi:Secretion system C-terminal sorting domain/SprB repeat
MSTKNLTLTLLFLIGLSQYSWNQTANGVFTQEPCNDDGVFTVTTTGLTLPITYTYYVDGNTIVHPNVNSVTDQLTNIPMSLNSFINCEVSSSGLFAFTQGYYSPQFQFEIIGTSPVCPAIVGSITANQISGSTGPFSYTWTNEQTLEVFSGNNATVSLGNYSSIITDQTTGCKLEINDSAVFIDQLSGITATISTTNANCTNGSATVVASGGIAPYTYLWANGASGASISGLSQGFYLVEITDAQGCVENGNGAYVNQTPQILVNTVVTNASCLDANGSIIAFGSGGVGPYNYSWSNGQFTQTATNLLGDNTFSVIVTDANGCVGQGYAYVNATTPINVSYTSTQSQCTSPTGTATLNVSGGVAPYTYHWTSNPSLNSPTITDLPAGSYFFDVTDANGCIRNGQVIISPISLINATIQPGLVVCPATLGSLTANVTGTNAPFTYDWSIGATTQTITGVPIGTYGCTITDALGCSVTKWGTLSSVSPVNVSVIPTPATCVFNTDGTAISIVTGGTAPYTYSYSNGSTIATASNLGVDGYNLNVTDANGCTTNEYFAITNANSSQDCYCTISGTVYVDGNSNCIQDVSENGIENIMIHCSGIGYAFTDANGNYSFQVPTGTYTISEQVNQYYPLSSCQSNVNSVSVVAASGCNTVVDFSNTISTIHDLKIVTINSTIPPIPGNPYQQKIVVKNEGTVNESTIQLGYEKDEQIPYLNSSLASFTQLSPVSDPDWFSVQTGFPVLSPNAFQVILLDYNTPTTIPIGTSVTYIDTVAHLDPLEVNWLLDNTPWNNYNYYQTTVIGAYDPNYKEVSPKGVGTVGNISTDVTEFDYTIHFQNEGTYFAQNIVVTDQLDADFDWTTLKPGYSDYEYSTTISETGLATFTFANINLPWKSTFGDVLSSGAFSYSIERKSTTPIGTEFTNSADIFFDYNAPITTNTTLNTLSSLGLNENTNSVSSEEISISLFPVPTNDKLSIQIDRNKKEQEVTIEIINLMGNVVSYDNFNLNENSTNFTKDVSEFMTGTYFIKFQFENGKSIIKKIIIHHN